MSGSSGIPSMLGTTDSAIRYARDIAGLDFTSVTNSYKPHTLEADFQTFARHQKDHAFVTLPSLEIPFVTGHKNVFFAEGHLPQIDPTSVETLWSSLQGRDCTVIAHHPNTHAETHPAEWNVHHLDSINPAFERHIEICQSRGSFEHDHVQGEVQLGGHGSSVRDALALGLRLGFVGGTDTHRAQPGLAVTNLGGLDAHNHVTGALTGVIAPELTRAAIWQALLARRCYTTTCVRILLDYHLNDHVMGSDVSVTDASDDAWRTRTVHLRVAGTGLLDRAVIVRNGVEVHEMALQGMTADVRWNDAQPLAEIADATIGGVYYYVKVYQRDGHIAWASPVWLTMQGG